MLVNGSQYRSIWLSGDKRGVEIIDQRFLPFEFVVEKIDTTAKMCSAIKDMHLRGAPLIGAAAGYGIYLAVLESKEKSDPGEYIKEQAKLLINTRPTAINLKWGVERMLAAVLDEKDFQLRVKKALETSEKIADEDVEICSGIGKHGVILIEKIYQEKKERVNIMTHCNAGALACVDVGTATSSMYAAFDKKIPIHVWVSETRPRNQGKLTSWELSQYGVPNTVIADNFAGHLMQHGKVDIIIVGTDRTTANGDVANKIGTYMKAVAAADNKVPFYIALPSPTIDWTITSDGVKNIPIEERDQNEVLEIDGYKDNKIESVRLFYEKANAVNYGFDVTPARLITGLITERGICPPNGLKKLFNIEYV
jgi:methylthioribose-1-phosphate isomerase